MDDKFVSFPSIEKFRHVLKNIEFINDIPKSLTFRGTVKLHGTNASIVSTFDDNGLETLTIQSRNRILAKSAWTESANLFAPFESIGLDNAGCRDFLVRCDLEALTMKAIEAYGDMPKEHVAIFGEYCGAGVQKHVAISKLPKMFMIFAINVDGHWMDTFGIDSMFHTVESPSEQIHNIMRFRTETVTVDLDDPEKAQAEFERLTLQVDEQCPVAMELGGVDGPGEGWVWKCVEKPYSTRLWFKTKGEKHEGAPKSVRKIASSTAMSASVEELVTMHVTEPLLIKGTQEMVAPDRDLRSLGAFVKWVTTDLLKEECDTIEENCLPIQEVSREVSRAAAVWFKGRCQEIVK